MDAIFRVYRGDAKDGEFKEYKVPVEHGMVVLDAMHYIQEHLSPDMAVRWNCKAGKCGSCSAEVNGKPRLMCMFRMDELDVTQPITVRPLQTFPVIKDLVTDVSWNYDFNKRIAPFTPRKDTKWRMAGDDIERVKEFRKCIECFLCQDVCHVLRDHDKKDRFAGPRYLVRMAGLEMHPLDDADRLEFIKEAAGIGYCNITKCCTDVCPESIHITDNAIIPLKERVADEYYDPLRSLVRKLSGKGK